MGDKTPFAARPSVGGGPCSPQLIPCSSTHPGYSHEKSTGSGSASSCAKNPVKRAFSMFPSLEPGFLSEVGVFLRVSIELRVGLCVKLDCLCCYTTGIRFESESNSSEADDDAKITYGFIMDYCCDEVAIELDVFWEGMLLKLVFLESCEVLLLVLLVILLLLFRSDASSIFLNMAYDDNEVNEFFSVSILLLLLLFSSTSSGNIGLGVLLNYKCVVIITSLLLNF